MQSIVGSHNTNIAVRNETCGNTAQLYCLGMTLITLIHMNW